MKPIKVLSLFDGISCGQVALERAGIPVEVYYASEIDKYAIQITQKNYPNTIQLDDVEKIDFTQFEGKIDLLIGGSPCTNLSIAGNRKGLEGDESRLFWEYVRAIKECKPKYFLLENVESMSDSDKEIISKELGCYPIMINSSLVSGQNRKRYYWFNWGKKQYNLFGFPTCDIPLPEDKGILLKDILESGIADREKSLSLTSQYYKGITSKPLEYLSNHQLRPFVAEPICVNSQSGRGDKSDAQPSVQDRIYNIEGKSTGLTTCFLPNIAEPICINIPETVTVRKYEVDTDRLKQVLREHKTLSNKEIAERLNMPITKVEHWFRMDDCFCIPDADIWYQLKELLNITTDEFDAAITEFEEKENVYEKAARKYSVNGKMSTLLANSNDEIIEPIVPYVEKKYKEYAKENDNKIPVMFNPYNKAEITEKSPTITTQASSQTSSCSVMMFRPIRLSEYEQSKGQGQRVYSVKGKSVVINGNGGWQGGKTGLYKIDLPDGDYIIRKLTPVECERLQTLPDNYTDGISNTQRYKCIGNGWTVDVIAHIFSFIEE